MKKVINFLLVLMVVISVLSFSNYTAAVEKKFNMSYLYFGNTDSFINSVERTNGGLDVVSPSYFDLNSDGSLKLTWQLDSTFVEAMHASGLKVVPFLSNHWDRELGRRALANREELTTDIANAIEWYNLDGINVDIENVTHLDKDAFTDLVRLLRNKIPAHKEVSVAVAANPNGWTNGWHGSYDYQKLATYADYLMVMAYDEHYEWGSVGPVASVDWVERSIQEILKYAPSDKIVLGLPLYGRYWQEGATHGGLGISLNRIPELLELYNGEIIFDESSKTPKATFTIKATDPKIVVGGRTLTSGNYTLWFEDNQSLKHKVDLVHAYDLKGVGSWSLGQEHNGLWTELNAWLNDIPSQEAGQNSPVIEEEPILDEVIVEEIKENEMKDEPNDLTVIEEPAVSIGKGKQNNNKGPNNSNGNGKGPNK